MYGIADKKVGRAGVNIEEKKNQAPNWNPDGFHWVKNYTNFALYEKEKNGIVFRRCYNYIDIGGLNEL